MKDKKDGSGKLSTPAELKLLATLRILGRGEVFDTAQSLPTSTKRRFVCGSTLHSAVELLFGKRLSGLRCDEHSVAKGLEADGRVGQVGKLQVELLDVDLLVSMMIKGFDKQVEEDGLGRPRARTDLLPGQIGSLQPNTLDVRRIDAWIGRGEDDGDWERHVVLVMISNVEASNTYGNTYRPIPQGRKVSLRQ